MVPRRAGHEERLEAALALWHEYLESQVWMHDREAPRLLQDAEALGRLLRDQDLPEVVDEVLGGIRHESPQVRSNAIEVLAEAELDATLEPLVRAALAGDADGVVQRQAAIAAKYRGLSTAYPLIKELALHSGDNLVRQDTMPAALQLAPDEEEFIRFAGELVQHGSARYYAFERVALDRFGPEAALRVLTATASERGDERTTRQSITKIAAALPVGEESTEELAFVATRADVRDPALAERLAQHPQAALRGISKAMAAGGMYKHQPLGLLQAIGTEHLEAADVIEPELKEWWLRVLRPPQPVPPTDSDDSAELPDAATASDLAGGGPQGRPALAELLQQSAAESDPLLFGNAVLLAREAEELDDEGHRELRGRLRRWWPEKGIAASISSKGIEWPAHACLAYGGYIMPPIAPDQWAEVAHVDRPYDRLEDWLAQRYRPAVVQHVVDTWTDRDAEPWARLLRAIPRRVPDALVEAIVGRVKRAGNVNYLTELADRLASEGQREALHELAGVGMKFARALAPYLGWLGDVAAQRDLLARLKHDLGSNARIDADDLHWMQGITDPSLLPDLFEVLEPSYVHRNPGDWNTSMVPIQEAIRRIGGPAAVAGYDALIADETSEIPGRQFLRYPRDAIVDDILTAAGNRKRPQLGRSLKLPRLRARPAAAETRRPGGRRRRTFWTG
jgi:hypothetical protein